MHPSSIATAYEFQQLTGGDLPFDLSTIPNNLEADNGFPQITALEAVLFAQKPDTDEDVCFFEQPIISTSLHSFWCMHESRDMATAIKQLTCHMCIDFNNADFVTPSNSPDVSWTINHHFVNMLICVGKDMGIGTILPNQNVNLFFNIKLGFQPTRSMLWISQMPSADNIWIAWVPKDEEEAESPWQLMPI